MEDKFHTVIIGAGPAGLQCASILAKNGHKVIVLERKNSIGSKVCAGGIPHHALADLHFPPELIENQFPTQHIHTPWQRAVIKAPKPIISTLNRQKLGNWMLQEARANGALVLNNTHVLQIGKSHIYLKDRKIGYKNLVGADGSSSMVRRYLNIATKKQGVGINCQIPRKMVKMEWHLDPKLFNSGYAWVFPHSQTTSVGAYAERQDMSAQILKDRFYLWAARNKIKINGTKIKAALINFDYQGWHFDNIFLAGDAAGLASGFTGEGIYPAIISGQTIARTLINPGYVPCHLERLIKQQQRHCRMQKFFAGNKVICQITLEMLVLAIRFGLIKFDYLEIY